MLRSAKVVTWSSGYLGFWVAKTNNSANYYSGGVADLADLAELCESEGHFTKWPSDLLTL
jgi:hypothetical protein